MKGLPHSHRILIYDRPATGISNVYPGSALASNHAADRVAYYEKYFCGVGNDNPVIEKTTIALDSDDPETRPANYTYRIWQRVA